MKKSDRRKNESSRSLDRQTNQTTIVAQYQGPLPAAAEMERYEQVQRGSADRILTMAEGEQENRHSLEMVGLVGGLVVWTLLLAATVLLAWLGARTAAAVVGSGVGLMMLDRFLKNRTG